MTKALITGLILLALISCDPLQIRLDAINALEKLKASKLGQDVFTSLMLEMAASNEQNANERMNSLLDGMYDDFRQLREQQFDIKSEKFAFCLTKESNLSDDIESYELKLAKATQRIPILEEQAAQVALTVALRQAEITQNENAMTELYNQNDAAKAAHEATVQEHLDMIEALKQAKTIIQQLATQSFLQKKGFSKTSLAQIQQIKKSLSKSHQVSMVTAILQLSQNIQADQSQVSHIVAIVEELIVHETEAIAFEDKVESRRIARFEYDEQRLIALSKFLEANIKDVIADENTYRRRVVDLQGDLIDYRRVIADKQEYKRLEVKACDDDLSAMEGRVNEYNEILDLIRMVMRLFKSATRRDIQEVLAEIN